MTLTPLGSRIYCITDIDPDHRKLSQLEAMVRFLTGEDPDLECACCPPTEGFPLGPHRSGLCRKGGLGGVREGYHIALSWELTDGLGRTERIPKTKAEPVSSWGQGGD